MTPEEFFTKALGIAPLTKMPHGLKTGSYAISEDPSDTLKVFRRVQPDLDKPYWSIQNGRLLVVTEADRDLVQIAMGQTYPE